MDNRRQAFRREPIVIELDPNFSLPVDPIPWEQRTDFGNEVVRQHVQILNEAVKIYVDEDTGLPQLEAKLTQKFSNPLELFRSGLPEETFNLLKDLPLYHNQVVEILLAICDINDLPQLKPMLDPNSQTPTPLGGILSTLIAPGADIPKTGSGEDSLPQVSEETPSELLPTPSLVQS